MEDSNNGPVRRTPRGQQIKQYVMQKMIQGEWMPDSQVPSEFDLVRQFNCSRMTVHYALRQLRDEGYLVRMPGLGTFVARPSVHLAVFKLTDIAHDLKIAGRTHRLTVIAKLEKRANLKESSEFQIARGERLFQSTILHFADDHPVQLEYRTVNASAVPDYLQQSFLTQTPFALLMQRMPYPEGRMRISAIIPTIEERKFLGMRASLPCIEVDRLTWNRGIVYSHARVLMVEPQALEAKITPPNGGPLT
jgi:GntR family histidine utilization transcriptional repressor